MVRALLIAIVIMAASACAGGDPSGASSPDGGRIVRITMSEFAFSPRTVTVSAGETLTFRLVNAGSVEHEFMVGRSPTPSRGYADDWLKRAAPGIAGHVHPGEQHLGEGVRVSPDWSGNVSVVIPQDRGTYEFGCFIAGHYEAGMKGILVVR